MVKSRVISKEEAQVTRTRKAPGIRRQRMDQFDEYLQPLRDNPAEAVVFEELDEPGQSFVLSLRGALRRNGLENAVVRKMRGRDEVRVWLSDEPPVKRSKNGATPAPVAAPATGRGRRKAS